MHYAPETCLLLPLTSILVQLVGKVGCQAIPEKRTDSGAAIGCFVCSSNNGSDSRCHDPFNADYDIYQSKCKEGRVDRDGVFPASFCIKMNGVSLDTGANIIVRRCAISSMANQCGIFVFQDERFEGCVVTCERDACNSAPNGLSSAFWSKALLAAATTALNIILMCHIKR